MEALKGFLKYMAAFLMISSGIIGAIIVLSVWFTEPAHGEEFDARVTSVYDGDTVTLLRLPEQQVIKLRLADIDAPELCQEYGKDARDLLRREIQGEKVRVVAKKGSTYGRGIGTIYYRDLNVNLSLVRDGAAWFYDAYSRNGEYEAAERQARLKRNGLWKQADLPTPPWEWRKLVKDKKIRVSYRPSVDTCRVTPLDD